MRRDQQPMNFSAVDRLACSREARLTSNYPELFFKLKEPATLRLPFVPPLLDTNFVGTSLARLVCMHTERSLSGLEFREQSSRGREWSQYTESTNLIFKPAHAA